MGWVMVTAGVMALVTALATVPAWKWEAATVWLMGLATGLALATALA